MYKIITLGSEFPGTYERRVTLLTNSTQLAKLSEVSNEITKFWNSLDKKPDKAYLHVIAMGAGEYFGSNNNGDYFSEKDLKNWHHTFVSNANVFKHHVNKDPQKSYGKVLFSYYNDNMHRVELVLEIDKAKAPDVAERIKNGEEIAVSMGCFLPGTRIVMADKTLKPIETVKVGDEVLTASGNVKKVSNIQIYKKTNQLISNVFFFKEYGKLTKLSGTPDHKVLLSKSTDDKFPDVYTPLSRVGVNNYLVSGHGNNKKYYQIVAYQELRYPEIKVYNIEVEDEHTYQVEGIATQNCKVDFDICSICGNKSKTRNEYCEHLKYNMNKILPDGRKVYAINPPPLKFFDISIVTRPADKTAWSLQKVAEEKSMAFFTESSAKLGEEAEKYQDKLAAVRKLSTIVKSIEGIPTEYSDDENPSITLLKKLKHHPKIKEIFKAYPSLDYSELDKQPFEFVAKKVIDTLPEGFSFGDMAYILLRKYLGRDTYHHIPQVMDMLPDALTTLEENPNTLNDIAYILKKDLIDPVYEKFENDDDDLEDDNITPKIHMRITLIKQAVDMGNSADILSNLHVKVPPITLKSSIGKQLIDTEVQKTITPSGPAFLDEFVVEDSKGNKYVTNRRSVLLGVESGYIPKSLSRLASIALILGGVGSIFLSKNLSKGAKIGIPTAAIGTFLLGTQLHNDTVNAGVRTVIDKDGNEIPLNTDFYKTSSSAPLMGMAAASALGLDYLYNRHIRYKNDPYYEERLSKPARIINKIGDKVVESPFTSLAVGGIGASILNEAAKKILRIKK